MNFENIIVETNGNVGVITINRPQVLNALSNALMTEMESAINQFENNLDIGALVITGNEKSFAAGADIAEMKDNTFAKAYMENFITRNWERVTTCRKPVIAAVAGYALGGGCELAMMCDFIIAGENAQFGQPEINLGIIPGAGGTQRFARLLGIAKALELILHGTLLNPQQALALGLVHQLLPEAGFEAEALEYATRLAARSPIALAAAKEAIYRGVDRSLAEGLLLEQELFARCMASEDAAAAMRNALSGKTWRWRGR